MEWLLTSLVTAQQHEELQGSGVTTAGDGVVRARSRYPFTITLPTSPVSLALPGLLSKNLWLAAPFFTPFLQRAVQVQTLM